MHHLCLSCDLCSFLFCCYVNHVSIAMILRDVCLSLCLPMITSLPHIIGLVVSFFATSIIPLKLNRLCKCEETKDFLTTCISQTKIGVTSLSSPICFNPGKALPHFHTAVMCICSVIITPQFDNKFQLT